MKKHKLLFSLIVSLFLVAFTTSKEVKKENLATHHNIGGAYLTFAGKFGGTLTTKKINTVYKLGVSGCATGSLITKFTLKVKRHKKRTRTFIGNSHILSNNIKTMLYSLKGGDSFEFSNVVAELPNGRSVDVFCKKFIVIP